MKFPLLKQPMEQQIMVIAFMRGFQCYLNKFHATPGDSNEALYEDSIFLPFIHIQVKSGYVNINLIYYRCLIIILVSSYFSTPFVFY